MSVNKQSKRLQQQKVLLDAIVSMDKEGCQYQVLFIIKDVIPLNKINYQVCDPSELFKFIYIYSKNEIPLNKLVIKDAIPLTSEYSFRPVYKSYS